MNTTHSNPGGTQQVYSASEQGAMAVKFAQQQIDQRNSGHLLQYGYKMFENLGMTLIPKGLSFIHGMSGELKSTFCKGIVRNVIAQLKAMPLDENGKRRVIFYAHTEEETEVMWAQLQCDPNVQPAAMLRGTVNMASVQNAAAKSLADPIFLIGNAEMASTMNPANSIDYGALTVRKIISAIWNIMQLHDVVPVLVVIDHLHDLSMEGMEHADEQSIVTAVDRELVNSARSMGCHMIVVGQDNAKQIVGRRDGMDRFPVREDAKFTNTLIFKSAVVVGVFQPSNGHVERGDDVVLKNIDGNFCSVPNGSTDDLFLVQLQKGRYANCKVNGRTGVFSARSGVTGVWGDIVERDASKFPSAPNPVAKKKKAATP